MTHDKKWNQMGDYLARFDFGSKGIWVIGIFAVVLVIVVCCAIFNTRDNPMPGQDTAGDLTVMPAQQAAYIPPGCVTCPTVTNCFPGAPGSGQQVALMNPFCANCPNVARCFPQGAPGGGMQPIALQQPVNDGTWVAAGGTQAPVPSQTTQATSAPPIFRDAVMPHSFRGVCELCHVVNPDIAISTNAVPLHGYRGVCSNCHVIQGLK